MLAAAPCLQHALRWQVQPLHTRHEVAQMGTDMIRIQVPTSCFPGMCLKQDSFRGYAGSAERVKCVRVMIRQL